MYKFIFFLFLLFNYLTSLVFSSCEVEGFSTLKSPNQLKDKIRNFITSLPKIEGYPLVYVTDQFTCLDTASELNKLEKMQYQVLLGENLDGIAVQNFFSEKGKDITNILLKDQAKMHNKFIINNSYILTGSPNTSSTSFNKNIESMVIINNKNLAELYRNYYQQMVDKYDANSSENEAIIDQGIIEQIENFNKDWETYKIKVCLAPHTKIISFIQEEIDTALKAGIQYINISMFLISHAKEGEEDIINYFMDLQEDIKLNLYYNHFSRINPGMKKAIETLQKRYNFTINPVKVPKGSMHDKLILLGNENKINKVLIGSAGLTDKVQANKNYENMLLIEDETTFNFFNTHFQNLKNYQISRPATISSNRPNITSKQLASKLQKAKAQFIPSSP